MSYKDRGERLNDFIRHATTEYPTFFAAPPEDYDKAQAHQASYQPVIDPLCGMGIGLPVSRLYARHFGGDLRMLSLQGYG